MSTLLYKEPIETTLSNASYNTIPLNNSFSPVSCSCSYEKSYSISYYSKNDTNNEVSFPRENQNINQNQSQNQNQNSISSESPSNSSSSEKKNDNSNLRKVIHKGMNKKPLPLQRRLSMHFKRDLIHLVNLAEKENSLNVCNSKPKVVDEKIIMILNEINYLKNSQEKAI